MKKEVWFGAVVLIVLIIIGVIYFSSHFPSKPRVRTLSNITELYSLFSPYMGSYINLRLQSVKCQPNEYYYGNSSICFVCRKFDMCVNYTWVNLTGGEKMSPQGAFYLTNFETFDSEIADFYNDGLATKLNCKPRNESVLSCDMSVSFVFFEKDVKMFLLEQANFERVSKFICNNFNESSLECQEIENPEVKYSCKCGSIYIYLKENGEIGYGTLI